MTRRSKLAVGALCAAAALLEPRTAATGGLVDVVRDRHDPLRVEIGWCTAMGAADPHDPNGVWATWGADPGSRTMQVHYSWVRTHDERALPTLQRLRACRLGPDRLECRTIYDQRPGHPAVGRAPEWNEVEERGASTANQRAEIPIDWGDGRRKGDVLFLRVNDEGIETSLKRGGFCPIPYPLHLPMDRRTAKFRWYGVEPDASNDHVSAAGLDLCRDGSRLASEAAESACISSVGWAHMRETLDRVERGQLRYMLGDEALVPPTTYHGPDGICAKGTFCGTRVFFQRIPRGAAFSAPGFLWFPTSKTDVPPGYDNGFAGSPSPFRFTEPAAHLVHYAAHELFHSLQYAWCRSGLTGSMTADDYCVFKDHPSFDRPPFAVDPWLQGTADGWWTCLDGYVDGDPDNPNVPCASATRITHQQNMDGLGEYNGWLAEPSRDLLRWRPDGSEPAYLFWSYVGEQFATARAPMNLSHPLRLLGEPEETTASRMELDPEDYNRPLGHAGRRPDEGADIRARVAEHFQSQYGEPVIDVLDDALIRHLGRSLRNVVVDLHAAMVLKDYVRVSDDPKEYWRWHLEWLGSHTAGATQEFFPQNPGVGVPSLEEIKRQQPPPFEGMLPVPISLVGRSPFDYTRRAYRARDSWRGMTCPCPPDAVPEPIWFSYGDSESSSESLHLEPFGMAVVSVLPAPRSYEPWQLRIRASRNYWSATNNRDFDLRVFTVSAGRNAAAGGPRAGQPALLPSCTFSADERALRAPDPIDVCRLRTFPASQSWVDWGYDESVLIGAAADNDVREVIAIFSAGDQSVDVSWSLGTGSYEVAEVRRPSASAPERITRYLGQQDELLGPVRIEARLVDELGDPVAIHPSQLTIGLPECYAPRGGADGAGCALNGADPRVQLVSSTDGWLRAMVSLPREWLPPAGGPTTELDLELEVAGTTTLLLERALRVEEALVLDRTDSTSQALGSPTRYERVASWTLDPKRVRTLPSLVVEEGADELLVSVATLSQSLHGVVLLSSEREVVLPETASDHVAIFRVPWPAPGRWTWRLDPLTPCDEALGPVFVEQAVQSRAKLDVSVEVLGESPPSARAGTSRGVVGYTGSELLVHALLADGLPIADARVVATITTPSGRELELELVDDGEPGEGAARDGHYAAVIRDTFEPGAYRVRVRAVARHDEGAPLLERERLLAVFLAEEPDTDEDALPGGPMASFRATDPRSGDNLPVISRPAAGRLPVAHPMQEHSARR